MRFTNYVTLLSTLLLLQAFAGLAQWQPDVLGNGFEMEYIELPADAEGPVRATLVRLKPKHPSEVAMLYVHGFNDYFFQAEAAHFFDDKGIAFFALDLRKYGRSLLPHQRMSDMDDVSNYYPELDAALSRIRAMGYTKTILNGHSTGGLICTVYAADRQSSPLFDALVLNSPFYDFNLSAPARTIALPMIAAKAKRKPNKNLKGSFSPLYGKSVYYKDNGEWDYNLDWKPHVPEPVRYAWLSAIYRAQKKIRKGISIQQPILLLYSDNSVKRKKWHPDFLSGDAVLNVKHIRKRADHIHDARITKVEIPGGMHDLMLSAKPVREQAQKVIWEWWTQQ